MGRNTGASRWPWSVRKWKSQGGLQVPRGNTAGSWRQQQRPGPPGKVEEGLGVGPCVLA